jgi:glutamine synthetase
VASNQSIAGPLVALNTIVADSLDYIATELEKVTKGDTKKLNAAVQKVLQQIIKDHGRIIFNGDGYSDAWHKEAAKRGLANNRTSPEALPAIAGKEVIETFSKYKVLSKRELLSRLDIYLEQYCKAVNIEALLAIEIARTMILPAAFRYQSELASTAAAIASLGKTPDTRTLDATSALVSELETALADLEAKATGHHAKSLQAEAEYYCGTVLPAMLAVRKAVDALEGIVADDLWPLPTYQEMLFIR